MADAKKLPSGSWRCRAKKVIDGKTVVRSFTVSPDEFGGDLKTASRKAKDKAELMARAWQLSQEKTIKESPILSDALLKYIDERSMILSPVSIKTYIAYIPYFDSIKDMYVSDIDTPVVQRLINDMAVSVSPKTIKSRIGFLLSVLDYAGNDRRFKLRYPQAIKRELTTPDHEDVYRLIAAADYKLKPVICLAAFGTLRRGEIAALKQSDISRDMRLISIHADMVLDKDNHFVYKDIPKTSGSVRSVQLPEDIIRLLPESDNPDDFVFSLSPTAITRRFEKLRAKLGLQHIRFHDLRHFSASFRSDIGIPKKYIELEGGWEADSKVLSSVYDNPLESSRRKYSQMVSEFIDDKFGDAIRISS